MNLKLQDGDEIIFGSEPDANLMIIDLPHPGFCNLKLAVQVACALYTCGTSEVINKIFANYDDEAETIESFPVYLDRFYVADDH